MTGRSDGATPVPRASTRQRRDAMVAELPSGNANVSDLAQRFGVSGSTIRRDLAVLADNGRITRTYGGAARPQPGHELTLNTKKRIHWAEKDAIGKFAASLVRHGDVVLLDAGTTVGRLAWHLRQCDGITIITNGMSSLLALADAPGVDLVLLGGRLRRPNEAFLGPDAERTLRRYQPDVAFLGVDGLDPVRGLNCPSPEQASIKELMVEGARQSWVLTDHWKIPSAPFSYWAVMPQHTGLITDADCPPSALEPFTGSGWIVVVAADTETPGSDPAAAIPVGALS
jgi:DeoR family fructose operon transcriptional repressor